MIKNKLKLFFDIILILNRWTLSKGYGEISGPN